MLPDASAGDLIRTEGEREQEMPSGDGRRRGILHVLLDAAVESTRAEENGCF